MEKTEIENRVQRLQRLHNLARLAGVCTTRKEFAEFLGVGQSSITQAFKGDERYLTDSFFIKIEHAFNNAGIAFDNTNATVTVENTPPSLHEVIEEMAEQRKSYQAIIQDLIAKIK